MRLSEKTRADGFHLITLDTVDSTNRYALEGAGSTISDRTWIVAATQTGGRGRHGREWHSPPGNLHATLLLLDPCPVALSPRLGFIAGIGVADAVLRLAPGIDVRLKWPNDLVAGTAKLTGILLEGRMLRDGRQAVAMGIGVNIAHAPDVAGREVSSLAALGCAADLQGVFAALCDTMARRIGEFARGDGFAAIRSAWMAQALPLGTTMNVKLPERLIAGHFAGIDETGRLALDTADGLVHVDAGDVFLAKPPL